MTGRSRLVSTPTCASRPAGPPLDLAYTIGATPTPSVDLVWDDDKVPFALLGISVFLRNDVRFDLVAIANVGTRL